MRARSRSRTRFDPVGGPVHQRGRGARARARAHVAGRAHAALEQPRFVIEAVRIGRAVRALQAHREPPALAGTRVRQHRAVARAAPPRERRCARARARRASARARRRARSARCARTAAAGSRRRRSSSMSRPSHSGGSASASRTCASAAAQKKPAPQRTPQRRSPRPSASARRHARHARERHDR